MVRLEHYDEHERAHLLNLPMSHVSTNFDRTGFQMDINMVLPLDGLRERARFGIIGSIAGKLLLVVPRNQMHRFRT
jgi:hypothetical protein